MNKLSIFVFVVIAFIWIFFKQAAMAALLIPTSFVMFFYDFVNVTPSSTTLWYIVVLPVSIIFLFLFLVLSASNGFWHGLFALPTFTLLGLFIVFLFFTFIPAIVTGESLYLPNDSARIINCYIFEYEHYDCNSLNSKSDLKELMDTWDN